MRGLEVGTLAGRAEPAVRIGAGVEQRRRGADERRRSRRIETQVIRETEADEGARAERLNGGGGRRRILCEKSR